MVECARLESGYAARHRGFESLSLRHKQKVHREMGLLLIGVVEGFEADGEDCLERQSETRRAAEERLQVA